MPSIAEFQPQPQATPLNDKGQQSLAQLLQNQAQRKRLQQRQEKAITALTAAATQINDRGTEADRRHTKRQERLQNEGNEEDQDDLAQNNALQEQVRSLTERMDHSLRNIIDDQNWIQAVPEVIRGVAVETGAVADATQRQTQASIPFTTQRGQKTVGESGDDDEDESMDVDENQEQVSDQPDPSETPMALLKVALEKEDILWVNKSLTDKYADSNAYRGFFAAVHDAKNPGEDAPPVPHKSTWFATEEGRQAEIAVRPGGINDGPDGEIEIQGSRIRIKCPYTQRTFQDPWTSNKCPHSFEKTAFFDALRMSDRHVPWTDEEEEELRQLRGPARARREREIRIPVVECPECSQPLEKEDVHPNPVLLRKVQRIVAREQKERESLSDDEDEDAPRRTQRKVIGLESSPPKPASSKPSGIKMESGRSRVDAASKVLPSGTQMTTADGATVIDLDVDDDDDEDDEDEDEDEDAEERDEDMED